LSLAQDFFAAFGTPELDRSAREDLMIAVQALERSTTELRYNSRGWMPSPYSQTRPSLVIIDGIQFDTRTNKKQTVNSGKINS
jgi:hypothetical protein